MITLSPSWIKLRTHIPQTPAIIEKYENLTIQIQNGYCGTLVALESLLAFILHNQHNIDEIYVVALESLLEFIRNQ